MAKTFVALYDHLSEAQSAINELREAGFGHDEISLVVNDATGEHSAYVKEWEAGKTTTAGDAAESSAIASGTITGGIIGGLAGILAGIGALMVPGIGPIIIAGPIVSGLIGAGVGAAGGGLLGALIGLGIAEEEAHYYAEGVRRGGALVAVSAQEYQTDQILGILDRHHPVNIEERASRWRDTGWERHDPEHKPYSPEEIEKERALYYR